MVVGYNKGRHATIALLKLPRHVNYFDHLQKLWLVRTTGCFPPLEACMVPSNTLKASPQVGVFQVRAISDSKVPVSEVLQCLLQIRLVFFWEDNHQKQLILFILFLYLFFGVSWTSLTDNSKRRLLLPGMGGFLQLSMSLGEALAAQM